MDYSKELNIPDSRLSPILSIDLNDLQCSEDTNLNKWLIEYIYYFETSRESCENKMDYLIENYNYLFDKSFGLVSYFSSDKFLNETVGSTKTTDIMILYYNLFRVMDDSLQIIVQHRDEKNDTMISMYEDYKKHSSDELVSIEKIYNKIKNIYNTVQNIIRLFITNIPHWIPDINSISQYKGQKDFENITDLVAELCQHFTKEELNKPYYNCTTITFIIEKSESEEEQEEECTICFDYLEENIAILKCGHPYHNDCIKDWMDTDSKNDEHKLCPYCKQPIEILKVVENYPEKIKVKDEVIIDTIKTPVSKYIKEILIEIDNVNMNHTFGHQSSIPKPAKNMTPPTDDLIYSRAPISDPLSSNLIVTPSNSFRFSPEIKSKSKVKPNKNTTKKENITEQPKKNKEKRESCIVS